MKKLAIGILLSCGISGICLRILNRNLYTEYEEFMLSKADSFELFYHKELSQKTINDKTILFECNRKFARDYQDFQMGEICFIMNFSPSWELVSFWGDVLQSQQVVEELNQKCPTLFLDKRFTTLWSSGDLVFQLIHPYSKLRYSVIGIKSTEFWQYRTEFFVLSILVGTLFGSFYFLVWGILSWLHKKPRLRSQSVVQSYYQPKLPSNENQQPKHKLMIRDFATIQKNTEEIQKYQSEICLYRSLSQVPKEIANNTKSYCQYVSRILCELLFPGKQWILQIFLPKIHQTNLLECVLTSQPHECLEYQIFLGVGEEGNLLNVLSPYYDPNGLYTTMSGPISKKEKMSMRITNINKAPLSEQASYLFIQSTLQCAKVLSKNFLKDTEGDQLLLQNERKNLPELDSNQRPSG